MTCEREGCDSPRWSKGYCVKHYFRNRRGHVEKYRDSLPTGYWSDVPVAGTGLLGAVITCQACKDQLGPVHDPASAALTIHAHEQRRHARRPA